MPPSRKIPMFWRVLWRLMHASRGPLILALVAVATGAAVCAALLNLDWDVGNKLTREFSTLGANVIISPRQASQQGLTQAAVPASDAAQTMDESVLAPIATLQPAPYLYLAARAGRVVANSGLPEEGHLGWTAFSPLSPVIVAGAWLDQVARMNPYWKVQGQWPKDRDDSDQCMIGSEAARQLGVAPGNRLVLQYGGTQTTLTVAGVVTSGAAEDNQLFVALGLAQQLAGLSGQIGLVQLSVPGTPAAVEIAIADLTRQFPDLDVRPVRQLASAEGRLFDRIHSLLLVTISVILALTALGVLASMAGLAMERRRDVGLMKALGGTVRRVMRFFLVEATALGLVGGILGCAAGMLLAGWIGQRVFSAAISPRWTVVPVTVALMIAVALAGALPLRLLGRTRPAEILRHE